MAALFFMLKVSERSEPIHIMTESPLLLPLEKSELCV